MNIMKQLKKGLQSLKRSIKRYPYALLFSTITTLIMIYLVNTEGYYNNEMEEMIARLAMTTALGFPVFLIIKSIFERKDTFDKFKKIILRVLILLAIIGYYFFFLKEMNMITMTRYFALSLSLYLFFLVITYYYRSEKFELYVIKIFSSLIITIIYSFVLIAGISIIFLTIHELLNINFPDNIYLSNALFIIGIFAPIFLLAQIPKQNENLSIEEFPKIFKILLIYIIMPLITVYTIILYIYFFKIIIIQELPKNLVTHLVLWYASLSIIVIFFISPIKIKNKWVKYFSKSIPIALIPLIAMMFFAIGIRIITYGVTESRYFVVALGIWIIGIIFYYIFSKKKKNIILPLSLAIIIVLSIFGPWSSYSVSVYSQNNRFEGILKKYEMINNNEIVKKEVNITENDKKEIQAIIRYFENNHKLADIRNLPNDFELLDTKKLFGFDYKKRFDPGQQQYFSYNLITKQKGININEYNYFFHLSSNIKEIDSNDNNLKVKINESNYKLTITNDKEIYSKSLIPIIIGIHNQNKDVSYQGIYQDNFIYIDENEEINVKIIFNSIYGSIDDLEKQDINIRSFDAYLLLK